VHTVVAFLAATAAALLHKCVGSFVQNGNCTGACGSGGGTLPERYVITVPAQYGGANCPRTNGSTRSSTACTNQQPCPPVDCLVRQLTVAVLEPMTGGLPDSSWQQLLNHRKVQVSDTKTAQLMLTIKLQVPCLCFAFRPLTCRAAGWTPLVTEPVAGATARSQNALWSAGLQHGAVRTVLMPTTRCGTMPPVRTTLRVLCRWGSLVLCW